jgi:hypothetical protein
MSRAAATLRGAPRAVLAKGGGVAVCVVAFAAASAGAQDALLSALSIDRAFVPPQSAPGLPTPERSYLGPVQLSYGFYIGADYNDNVNGSQHDVQPDLISHIGTTFSLAWNATDKSLLQFGAGIGYLHYLNNSQNGGLEITPNSALSYQIHFTDGTLALFDQISYTRQVAQEVALANVATLPRLDNTVGARVTWNPRRWELQAGYSHDDYLSTSESYKYLNRSSEYLFSRGGWRFAESTQAGLEASGGFTTYQQSIQSDDSNLSLGPYAEWQATSAIRASIRGGFTGYFFSAPKVRGPGSTGSSTLNSYYLGLDASDQLTDFFSHSISLQRITGPGYNLGSDYVQQLVATYSFGWALRKGYSLGGQVQFARGNQPLPFVANGQEHFRSWGGGPSLGWTVTPKLGASLSYSVLQRSSDLYNRSYLQNIVSLNLTYAFR